MNHRARSATAHLFLVGLLAAGSALAAAPAAVPASDAEVLARALGVKSDRLTVTASTRALAESQARPNPLLPLGDPYVQRYAEFLREAGNGGRVVHWTRAAVPPASPAAEGYAVVRDGILAAILPRPSPPR